MFAFLLAKEKTAGKAFLKLKKKDPVMGLFFAKNKQKKTPFTGRFLTKSRN